MTFVWIVNITIISLPKTNYSTGVEESCTQYIYTHTHTHAYVLAYACTHWNVVLSIKYLI